MRFYLAPQKLTITGLNMNSVKHSRLGYFSSSVGIPNQTELTSLRETHPVIELNHFCDDFLINGGENRISNELHVFVGELVHKDLERLCTHRSSQ